MSNSTAKTKTRFAPSPSGELHLGHAFSALTAWQAVGGDTAEPGQFIVRIEDLDPGRARPEFEDAIFEDLAWLGLKWEMPVRRQSEHMDEYRRHLGVLDDLGLLYPCFCTRAEIKNEIAAAASAPHAPLGQEGPDGPHYPGTCRNMDAAQRQARQDAGDAFALRLDMEKAVKLAHARYGPLSWVDTEKGETPARPELFGDVVLARKDVPTSYHLAVTVDDHLQAINLVVRGQDLFEATHVHRLLQALLGLETPTYHHHPLVLDDAGQRLAKRDRASALKTLRNDGITPAEIRSRLDLAP